MSSKNKIGLFVAMMAASMSVGRDPEKKDPEKKDPVDRWTEEELMSHKGLRPFTNEAGQTVWAINQKNANRKFKKL